jgi:hypothetical protein
MHPAHAPIVDFPVARAHDEVMRAFIRGLCLRADWDVLLMPGLSGASITWKGFQNAVRDSLAWRVAARFDVPYLSLSARDPFLRATIADLRHTVASCTAEEQSVIRIEEHRHVDPRGPLLEEALGVVRQSDRRIASLGRTTADEIRRFFRELTARASAKGWLSLWVARMHDAIVAAEYQISANGSVHALRRDADQGRNGFSFTDLLTLSILRSLVDRHTLHTYYQLPVEGTGKPGAASGRQETFFVEAFAPHLYGQLLHRLETRVLPIARRLAGQRERPCA